MSETRDTSGRTMGAHGARIDNLEDKVAAHSDQIGGLHAKVDDVNKTVSDIKTNVAVLVDRSNRAPRGNGRFHIEPKHAAVGGTSLVALAWAIFEFMKDK